MHSYLWLQWLAPYHIMITWPDCARQCSSELVQAGAADGSARFRQGPGIRTVQEGWLGHPDPPLTAWVQAIRVAAARTGIAAENLVPGGCRSILYFGILTTRSEPD